MVVAAGVPNRVQGHFLTMTFVVAALGYFVDIFDLVLFGIVRVQSLQALGLSPEAIMSTGVTLINCQMAGLLCGGLAWGMLGDKKGRLSVLLASICLYSVANIANAFVSTVEMYALWRFVAGFGLAGEFGAAITLVSESIPASKRGMATGLLASFGILGAVAAALVGDYASWQTAYIVGGVLGLALLLLRVSMKESPLFDGNKNATITRGDPRLFFSSWPIFRRYLLCVLMGVPIWYVIGILMTFSPELSKALGATDNISAGKAILASYIGLCVGDLSCAYLSQKLASRRVAVMMYLAMLMCFVALYLLQTGLSAMQWYTLCAFLGFAGGYWAIFSTIVAENFGTNIRATAVTSATNFVRAGVIVLTLSLEALKEPLGLAGATLFLGFVVVAIAFYAIWKLPETFGRDLNFVDLHPSKKPLGESVRF